MASNSNRTRARSRTSSRTGATSHSARSGQGRSRNQGSGPGKLIAGLALGAAALAAGTYAVKKIQERRERNGGRADDRYDTRS